MINIFKPTTLLFTAFVAVVSVATISLGNTNVLAQSCVNGDGVNCSGTTNPPSGGSPSGGTPSGGGGGCTNAYSVNTDSASYIEGTGKWSPITINIGRSCDSTRNNSVVWTVKGTGVNPTSQNDFSSATSGTLTFDASTRGLWSKAVTVNTAGDSIPESNETFHVCLTNLTGDPALIGNENNGCSTIKTIIDDDSTAAPPVVDPGSANYVAPESLPCTDPTQNLWQVIGRVLCSTIAVGITTVVGGTVFAVAGIPAAITNGVCQAISLNCTGIQQVTNSISNALQSVANWTVEVLTSLQHATPSAVPPPTPVVLISADKTSISPNGSTTLKWSSSNADWCTASGGWSGTKANSGTELISSIANTREFKLTCKNKTAQVANAVTVVVVLPPPPTLTVSANPTKVSVGFLSSGATTISWSSTNADTCYRSWFGLGVVQGPTSGSDKVGGDLFGIWGPSNFTVTCTGKGGNTSKTVNVST